MKEKKRVLSVDFDYFVNCSAEFRDECFPDPNENNSPQLTEFLWYNRTNYYPAISALGVTEEYIALRKFLKEDNGYYFYNAESHGRIMNMIYYLFPKDTTTLEVVNVDYHHDRYAGASDRIDCGNWLRILLEERPDTEVLWVRREDSVILLEYPYFDTTDFSDVKGHFDAVFMCFSPEWTPPHLRKKYDSIINNIIPRHGINLKMPD